MLEYSDATVGEPVAHSNEHPEARPHQNQRLKEICSRGRRQAVCGIPESKDSQPRNQPDKQEAAAKPEPMPEATEGAPSGDAPAQPAMGMGMGMFGGMGRRGNNAAAPEIKYDATVFGRYAKILFSSSEFLFIN